MQSVVYELIQELCNGESVFLIGCGMGAVLSWALLGKRPELASKLMILSEGHRTRLKTLIPPGKLFRKIVRPLQTLKDCQTQSFRIRTHLLEYTQ